MLDIDIKYSWVDESEVITWFELHTNKTSKPLSIVNWSTIQDGRIIKIRVTFDPRPLSLSNDPSACGSNLISLIKDRPEIIGLPIGGLDQDPGNRPEMNIFVGSKAPWYEIIDYLPQYQEWPPEGAAKVRFTTET
jgi:hypothetical protein